MRRHIQILLSFAAMAIGHCCEAQTIHGRAVDHASGKGLSGVDVYVAPYSIHATTDKHGRFDIELPDSLKGRTDLGLSYGCPPGTVSFRYAIDSGVLTGEREPVIYRYPQTTPMIVVLTASKGQAIRHPGDSTAQLSVEHRVPDSVAEWGNNFQGAAPAGGDDSARAFLSRNLHYPYSEIESNIMGRVVFRFWVEENGDLSEISLVKMMDPTLEEVVRQTIMAMPRWKPATYDGEPVRSRVMLAFDFRLR